MSRHVLITYAKRHPYREVPAVPDGSIYDYEKGFWLKDNQPFAASAGAPGTKKCDQETGEDQKGE